MGNSGSHEGDYDGDDDYAEQFDGVETLGYRVLGVQPNSPASKAGLVSFFDFIVGANEQMLLGSGEGLEEGEEYDDIDFPALLKESNGKPVELLVWNIKAQEKRVVQLIPTDDWGGAGLLGVTIKLDDYGGADERLVRVLEIEEHSPAAVAGLIPEQDFLLGTTACALQSADVLARVLMENVDRVVELYVYNSTSDMVRVVGLLPTYSWGDHNSLLGAEVGTGYLHRLPTTCRDTIGQSVERRVQVLHVDEDEGTMNGETIRMEHHLEMEVDEDDRDVRAEESIKQPHQLGRLEHDRDVMGRSLETQESLRSISLVSEGGEPHSQHSHTPADTSHEPNPETTPDEGANGTTIAGSPTQEDKSSQESPPSPSFPDAAPIRDDQPEASASPSPPAPALSEQSDSSRPPPPPPPAIDSASSMPPPPPPPPPPPLPQGTDGKPDQDSSPPPPPPPPEPTKTETQATAETVNDEDEEDEEDDEVESEEEEASHEEDSEEETDSDEYETDSEEEEDDEAPRSGGFLSSFRR